MKKSLSILLSFALVFGLFASMASAADTELTAAQKYQILVDKGILKGNPDGDARLNNNLNRAEFATVAIAISGLTEEKPATATFSDVNSKQWWYGAIEAAAKAGLVEGYNGKFDPRSNVTIEQVIKVAVQAAGLNPVEDAEVEGASAWAGPYIQAALDAGLISAGLDYKADATRGQTFVVGYSVYEKLNPTKPDKVTVDAKASGVKKVEVSLGKEVDTTKAVLTLKKGGTTIAVDTKWADNKESATLTLKDVKISAGTYSVTLTGLDEAAVAKATSEFTAENETVKSIDFVSSVAEIAYTANAKIKVAAKNQYDELASFASTYYTVFTGYTGLGERIVKDEEGYLNIVLNTNLPTIMQNQTQIPVTIYYNDTRLNASKTFKVGNAPFVTKMELGEVKYDGTKTSLTNAGEVALVPIKLYDQYGNPITKDQTVSSAINFNQFVAPHSTNLSASTDDFNNDNTYETKITLASKEAKAATYTLTVYAGGTSANTTFSVGAGKVATKVGFGEFDAVLAEGDTDPTYIPVVAYDSEGNQLTKDELVDNVNIKRIKVSVSGPVQTDSPLTLVPSGPNKGSIKINSVHAGSARSTVMVNVSIAEIDSQDYKSLPIVIQEGRKPEKLVLDTASATKAVLGANSDFKVLIKDQHNKTIDNLGGYEVDVSFYNQDSTNPGITLVGRGTNVKGNLNAGQTVVTYVAGEGKQFNDGFTFDTVANNPPGKVQFKAELFKVENGSRASLGAITQTIETINPANVDLYYSLKDLGNLYAIKDSGLIPLTEDASNTHIRKKIEIVVKDAAGNSVAFPDDMVQDVSVSGIAVSTAPDATNNKLHYVMGNKPGTSSVTATVYNAKGEVASVSGTVTVKSDPVAVETISAGNGDKKANVNQLYDAYDLMDLKVVDNYGIEYKAGNIAKYKELIGVVYTVTNVKGNGATVTLTNGQITIGAGVTEFLLSATANGKTTSTLVYTN